MVPIRNVEILMEILRAHALSISWEVHQIVNQSAPLMLNVQVIWLALAKNVEILVLDRVELLLSVTLSITYPLVPVMKDTLETLSQVASHVHYHVNIYLLLKIIDFIEGVHVHGGPLYSISRLAELMTKLACSYFHETEHTNFIFCARYYLLEILKFLVMVCYFSKFYHHEHQSLYKKSQNCVIPFLFLNST